MATPLALLGDAIASGTRTLVNAKMAADDRDRKRAEALQDFEMQQEALRARDERQKQTHLALLEKQYELQGLSLDKQLKNEQEKYDKRRWDGLVSTLVSNGLLSFKKDGVYTPEEMDAATTQLSPQYKMAINRLAEYKAMAPKLREYGVDFDEARLMQATPADIDLIDEMMNGPLQVLNERMVKLFTDRQLGEKAKADYVASTLAQARVMNDQMAKNDETLASLQSPERVAQERDALLLGKIKTLPGMSDVVSLDDVRIKPQHIKKAQDSFIKGIDTEIQNNLIIRSSQLADRNRQLGNRLAQIDNLLTSIRQIDFKYVPPDRVNQLFGNAGVGSTKTPAGVVDPATASAPAPVADTMTSFLQEQAPPAAPTPPTPVSTNPNPAPVVAPPRQEPIGQTPVPAPTVLSEPQAAPSQEPSQPSALFETAKDLSPIGAAAVPAAAKAVSNIDPRLAARTRLAKAVISRAAPSVLPSLGNVLSSAGGVGVISTANNLIGKGLSDQYTGDMTAIEGIAQANYDAQQPSWLKDLENRLDALISKRKAILAANIPLEQKQALAAPLTEEINRLMPDVLQTKERRNRQVNPWLNQAPTP